MTLKPTRYPEWATIQTQDPITKELNRYEPPQAKKDIGWVRGEAPSRQWVNDQNNLIDAWIKYFDSKSVADKAGLPDATKNTGVTIYVIATNELAISDGTTWKKVLTGTLT